SLGYRLASDNPWTKFIEKYAAGDVANVEIVKFMPFGAFAEVMPGVDGLIHISQIADKRIGKPEEVLKIGQKIDAKITEIDMENKKISLSIRALLEAVEAPVEEAADAE
ncbi:MAG: S1 RNA-binding domain-containing protein, partial [Clostridia bacterium]|nr:S1 RNA-binding domain-containing protein [Clostridia bacterium]